MERGEIKDELVKRNEAQNERHAGIIVTAISKELGILERDYLRQVVKYEKPNPWEKDNYRIEENQKDMVRRVLNELGTNARA